MCRGKTFLSTAVILVMASVANASLVLTLNGLDTRMPIEVKADDDIIIAVAGQTDEQEQRYSVTSKMGGKLEPLPEPNSRVKKPMDCYLFKFEEEGRSLGVVDLHAEDDHIYELVLFYNPETDVTIVLGIGYDALHRVPDVEEPLEMSSIEAEAVPQGPVIPDTLQS